MIIHIHIKGESNIMKGVFWYRHKYSILCCIVWQLRKCKMFLKTIRKWQPSYYLMFGGNGSGKIELWFWPHYVLEIWIIALKMLPLEANRFVLTWMCVYPAEKATSTWTKRFQKIVCLFEFAVLTTVICSSSIRFLQSLIEHEDEEIVFTVMQTIGILNAAYVMTTIFICRDEITHMINILAKIYNGCKCKFKPIYSIPDDDAQFLSKWMQIRTMTLTDFWN